MVNFFTRWKTYIKALYGVPDCQYEIGKQLFEVKSNEARKSSIQWFVRSAEQGYVDACMKLAIYYIDLNQTDIAIQYLRLSSIPDDASPQALLGQLLLNKYTNIIDLQRIKQDTETSADGERNIALEVDKYVQKLYESSLPKPTQVNSTCSDQERDAYLADALHFLQIALDRENPLALHAKAIYLLEYTNPSKAQQGFAVLQLTTAANKGFAPSMNILAGFYENGKFGVKLDIEKGLNLRIRAASTGSKESQFTLGCLVYKGSGFVQHREKGLALLEMAAKNGHIEAQNFLNQIKTNSDQY